MTPEEQSCGPGTQNLDSDSGTSSRHLKILAPVPQLCVRRWTIECCQIPR